MSSNKCHCNATAPWLVAVIARTKSTQDIADDAWAACDDHLVDAVRRLIARQGDRPRDSYRVVLRGPNDATQVTGERAGSLCWWCRTKPGQCPVHDDATSTAAARAASLVQWATEVTP